MSAIPPLKSMCGRYSLTCIDDLGRRFRVFVPEIGLRSRFNVPPGSEMPVILPEGGEGRLSLMRWGLIPAWAKDPAIGRRLINARAETLTEKPSFRSLVRRKRCLVPATGFYEWNISGRGRIPYYIRMKDDCLCAFAGLYDEWQSPAGVLLKTYAIITTEPNDLIRPIHSRMPAILRREDEGRWLQPGPLTAEEIRTMLAPRPAEDLEAYPVSLEVNNPEHDGEHLTRRAAMQVVPRHP